MGMEMLSRETGKIGTVSLREGHKVVAGIEDGLSNPIPL